MQKAAALFLALIVPPVLFFAAALGQQPPATPAQPAPAITDQEAAKLPYSYSISGFEDQGAFTLLVNEEALGNTDFVWRKDGSYESHFTLKLAGQSTQTDCRIEPGADGIWKRVEVKSTRGTQVAEREGRLVTASFQDRKSTAQLKEKSLLFDNYGPGLCAAMIREYDQAKGGRQEITVCVNGSGAVEAGFERLEAAEKAVAGKDVAIHPLSSLNPDDRY